MMTSLGALLAVRLATVSTCCWLRGRYLGTLTHAVGASTTQERVTGAVVDHL
jgi:hypothetical protein